MTEANPPLHARKKPGPPKGSPRRGGKKKGSKNKKTIEREKAKALELERARLASEAEASGSLLGKATAQGRKLMKEIGFDMTQLAAGLAAFYQPWPTWTKDAAGNLKNDNPNYDEGRFRYYLEASMAGASQFSSYESPKLSAVLVNQQIVNKIEVSGGMPDEFAAPEGDPQFKPGDIVSAEEGVADKRVVNGEILPLPAPAKAAG